MDRRLLLIVAAFGGTFLLVLGAWEVQACLMKREFIRVMLGEGIENPPLLMKDKRWTKEELRHTRVVRVPRSAGQEQALVRLAHLRGAGIPTNPRYGYQAIVTDSETGITHVYGRLRDRGVWAYYMLHPESAKRYIEQRDEAVQQLRETVGQQPPAQ